MANDLSAVLEGFAPVKGGRKSDDVYAQIAEFIRGGRFAPGTKLPAERELAATFRTSRQTIREALYRAELNGLIEVRHGTGSFVAAHAPQAPGALDLPLIELIRKEAHRIGEFFEIRRAIEGWCAAQAAKTAPESALADMKARLDAMRSLDVTDEEWERNDIAFHAALAAATGNPIAVKIMAILREGFSAFYRFKRFIPNREDQKLIWQHHADIYEGVKRGDGAAARAAIVAHMDFIEEKLAEGMSEVRE
jgi:GntR family transcriptional repressor for pyruvate dehydrogenase complex